MQALPLAYFGALLVLLMDEELNIFSFVGIMLLVGLVKKNSIMMVAPHQRDDRPRTGFVSARHATPHHLQQSESA